MEKFIKPRLLTPREQNHKKFWQAVGLCALTAAIFFLPFYILDGGFFHYAGDFNSQQITFYRYMNGFVKGAGYPDSAFAGAPRNTFSWATDLGSGVMNAYSFYLYGSPFFWLSVLLPQSWLPYMMVPLLVLKFGVAGGGAYLYLRRYVKSANYAVLGACLYALSGFAVYNVFFNHFVDVVALFPYLLWALDEAIYENRHGLFAFWVAVNLLNNYFFFVGQVIFLCIYFVCKLTAKDFRLAARKFGHLLWESVLGVAMGCLLLFPAVLSLLQNPRTIDLSSGWGFLTYAKVQQYLAILLSWILPPDSPYLTSVWSEGVIKWTSMTAYLPLCSLAGAMAYWRSRKADSKKRIVAVCAVCALVPVLNSAFYALNSSYYARWYYMPTLILAAMTVNALEDPDVDLDAPARGIGWIMLATLVFAVVPVRDDTTETWSFGVLKNPEQFFVVLGFGLLGLMLYRVLCSKWRQDSRFAQRMTAAVLVFACAFTMVHIGIGKFGQWHTDSDLVEQDTNALLLKNDLPEGDYRIDTYKVHDNIGMWLDKSCLQYFGSTAAPSILSFYPGLGVKRDVRSEPEITNYALRGLLSVEYLITTPEQRESFEDEADAGWTYLADVDGYTLYHNDNYVPMGFTYDYYVTDATYQTSIKTLRSNLLMRALVLTDEDVAQYGKYLTELSEDMLNDLHYDSYTQDCADRRAHSCSVFQMNNAGFHAEITLDKPNLVFFSVPYDDGFTAYVNGEKTDILQVDEGLMAVLCPAGASSIDFVYQAAGLSASRVVTAVAIPVWVVYVACFVRRKRRSTGAPAEE
ncbi:YfhO family protein [Faecalibacterium prausnitzii]|uniref:Predicted membrane protein n=1 Tax=Faecalibacterium prausnitzii TaxID=853 RepID=A0A173U9D3_9FIRM|nr:YfhO family protein [Faecalibacterium prausnitzii]CUN11379.1 Predicted membrane protein [Faecalibacterium prausnitzii]